MDFLFKLDFITISLLFSFLSLFLWFVLNKTIKGRMLSGVGMIFIGIQLLSTFVHESPNKLFSIISLTVAIFIFSFISFYGFFAPNYKTDSEEESLPIDTTPLIGFEFLNKLGVDLKALVLFVLSNLGLTTKNLKGLVYALVYRVLPLISYIMLLTNLLD